MGIVFDEAPAVQRPAPRPASSSEEEDGYGDEADDAPGRDAHEPASPAESLSDDSSDGGSPARGGMPLVSQDEGAWARALRQAASDDGLQGGPAADTSGVQEPAVADAPASGGPSAARNAAATREDAARPRKKAAQAAATPVDRKGVAAALERTRLGEGRQGVYFADTAFDWRDLAVNPAQQTWSLLGGDGGGATDDAAPEAAGGDRDDDAPMPSAPEPLALARRALPSAPPVNLHTLGSSFMRSEADNSLRSAWEANREALAVDFKAKRRQALRSGRPGAPKHR